MKNIFNSQWLTAFNLFFLGALAAYAVNTLGSDEGRFREHLLFRDGSTTVTGDLVAASGAWTLSQEGHLYLKDGIELEPDTSASVAELRAKYVTNTIVIWEPLPEVFSMVIMDPYDQVAQLETPLWEDRDSNVRYDAAIMVSGDNIRLGRVAIK